MLKPGSIMEHNDSNDMEGSSSGLHQHEASDSESNESDCSTHDQHKKHDYSSESGSSDSDLSDSSIEIKPRKPKNSALIDSDSENSESDWEVLPSQQSRFGELADESSSSESDGESDKCPICLAKFKGQEIGLPDSCEHRFCCECILEWSKNVTTCPIDRQQFKFILVYNLDGSIIRQIPVHEQQVQEPAVDFSDQTFCEVCQSSDREDRMLLCDGCDLGYHLECLTPPLEHVPTGSWMCPECGPEDVQDVTIYVNELEVLYHDAEEIGPPANAQRVSRGNNIIPRTRQSDRIRARIFSNRHSNRISTVVGDDNIHVTVDHIDQPSTSRRTTSTTSIVRARQTSAARRTTTTRTKKVKRKTRKARKPRIKITYEIDEATGKKIVIETKSRRRRFKRKSRKKRARVTAKTSTKSRLAKRFGICAPRKPGQTLPDVRAPRVPLDNKNINCQRGQAGIPTLNMFGAREELMYFSGSDDNDEGDGGASASGNVLVRRRPNMNDAAIFRRSAARKAHLLPSALQAQSSSSSIDLLGSIMDSQEKMHSKKSVLSLSKDGTLKIDTNKNFTKETNRNSTNRVNINDHRHMRVRNVPTYSTNDNPANIANVNSPQEDRGDNRREVATSSATISNNSVSTSTASSAHGGEGSEGSNSAIGSGVATGSGLCGNRETDSEVELYSDIETVSTSKVEEVDSDKEESDVKIDGCTKNRDKDRSDDKPDEIEDAKMDAQEENVSSTTNNVLSLDTGLRDEQDRSIEDTDDDECPNFSIYSKDTINLVAKRSLEQDEVGSSLDIEKPESGVISTEQENNEDFLDAHPPPPTTDGEDNDDNEDHEDADDNQLIEDHGEQSVELNADVEEININDDDKQSEGHSNDLKDISKDSSKHNLYSDSDDELVKTDTRSFGIGDIRDITEDISDEERSYTPCLDEKGPVREGLEGLDTEAISEDEKNDFEESHEQKTISDGGDALEINAKECEMDFTKPEDYEEGEIVDKLKRKTEDQKSQDKSKKPDKVDTAKVNKSKDPKKTDKENNAPADKEPSASFKRINKITNRNYRDKDRSKDRSLSKEKNKENEREKKRDRKKERRKELERYNVRNVVSDKPRKSTKDKFGRDARRRSSSRSRSPSYSPPYRSTSRGRRSISRDRIRKHRGRSRARSSPRTRSRSRSRSRKRSVSRKRRSFSRTKRRRCSVDDKKRKKRTPSRHRSRSRSLTPPARRQRDWEPPARTRWSPSMSRSRSPEKQASPSWTPPRIHDNSGVKPRNLTVILTNDANKSKKKNKGKGEKKKKESAIDKNKKRKRDKTPLPSKEVFASGDNILVSVSFNKETEELNKRTKQTRTGDDDISTKRTRKEKEKRREHTRTPPIPAAKSKKKKAPQKDLSGVKPVAIIDLDRSPFKEMTPSPKDVIVLSDSDHSPEKVVPDSSQQIDYSMGPKTPPEPQVKFSLSTKQPQIRQISNPLHDPDEEIEETEIDPQDELEQRLNDALHKGPNTPSEPPNSAPSSPDAYDPFDPTKSRSPTPEVVDTEQDTQTLDDSHSPDLSMERDKIPLSKTPEISAGKSHTPPLADIQPADSQSNSHIIGGSTPEDLSKVDHNKQVNSLNANAQGNSPIFSTSSKNKANASIALASTPTSSLTTTPRVSILNSTIITPIIGGNQPPSRGMNTTKTPLKPSPTKASVKMMPKRTASTGSKLQQSKPNTNPKSKNRSTDSNDSNMDLDSPYSPGPSDFEDLFEPPTEHKKNKQPAPPSQLPAPPSKQSNKLQSTFDVLFGSPGKNKNKSVDKNKKQSHPKIKQVGLKFDEDSLKILDDLPNSAVEMQVKDKYLKKLNRQERVVEEVKLVLKPHYNKKHINKDEYKDILRRAVPKICHNKAGEINPKKIQNLVEAYVKKIRHTKKVSSSSSVGAQK